MDLPCNATIDVDAFLDVLKSINDTTDHVDVIGRRGHLLLAGSGGDTIGDYGTVADFGPAADLNGTATDDETLSKITLD